MTPEAFSSGDAAWMLISASLVLLMTPGLALFYGGMAGNRHVLNMMMMSFGALALVPVLYVLWGWSMSYAESSLAGIVGNPFEAWGLRGQITGPSAEYLAGSAGYPNIIDIGFQTTFAIISTAIISGALAGRVKFSAWLTFAGVWITFAYFPLAHMVWGGGVLSHAPRSLAAWLFGVSNGEALIAPIDFAGGTVVHISAGAAALVLAIVVGPRAGFPKHIDRPHNLPMVMLGAALLWFGWFGFNGGSAFAADGFAGLAWLNTTVAAAAAMLGWMLVERIRDHAATSLGAASGAIAGLVAISPAAGALSPLGSIALGFLGGIIACLCISLKYRWGFDDSLDVVGVHLCAGLWGTIGLAFFATDNGILTGHLSEGFKLLVVQAVIALVAMLFSAAVTLVVALLIRATLGWRADDEDQGIDLSEHRESAYDFRESVASHRRHTHDARINPAPTVQPRVDTAGAKE
ncbi:ammonium transporter [Corynebacterium sp. HMSC072A04]|uniref:ammonium transporter n=1 Tax=Corynebacterium sp. HMSC072A04 TaxID=1715045 RepID=UPI0008B69E5D|nr:ammonium transporter [Corynebacterium sp. HMSC072A04]OFN38591.1 ammonium transporter [Corynebacterium sp. HMSC072A04]